LFFAGVLCDSGGLPLLIGILLLPAVLALAWYPVLWLVILLLLQHNGFAPQTVSLPLMCFVDDFDILNWLT
jgi:hypothetical protein